MQHPADLLVPPDHGIQLAALRQRREILGVLFQGRELLLGPFVLHTRALTRFADCGLELLPIQSESLQQLLHIRVRVREGQEHGIRRKEPVPQSAAGIGGQLQEVPECRSDMGLGTTNGLGESVDQILGAIDKTFGGFGLKPSPFQYWAQSHLRS